MHHSLADLTDAHLDERIRYTAPDHPSAEPLRVERARRSLTKARDMARVVDRDLVPAGIREYGTEEAARWATVGFLLNMTDDQWEAIATLAFQTPASEHERQMCIDLVASGVPS